MPMGRAKGLWPMPGARDVLSLGIRNMVKAGGALNISEVMLTGGVLMAAPALARPCCADRSFCEGDDEAEEFAQMSSGTGSLA